ncbi:MAG: PaaI family thioesterase [Chloroflexota bacterium]
MTENRSRTYSWADPLVTAQQGMQYDGITYLQKMIDGEIPPPSIAQTLEFRLKEVREGHARFEGVPQEFHYNPIGVVHGGLAATLLDSALGCAVQTTVAQGIGYTTLQLNVNLVRAITKDTGLLICEANTIHVGRQMATAEAELKDEQGKLYAHGTTTCLIFKLPM